MKITETTYREMKMLVSLYETEQKGVHVVQKEEQPYFITKTIETHYGHNPKYGDDRICECGHPYYRHFDTYEQMAAVGCKYCGCYEFKEDKQ